MRRLLRLAAAGAFAAAAVLPVAQAEAVDCGLLRPVCSVYCRTTYETLGWMCVA